ncbi:MAG: cupin domain-containing protein [Methanomassiliicoccales archaeon]|jgi:mannose-6-phosphate isomerase-like protein (cupin superfamily)
MRYTRLQDFPDKSNLHKVSVKNIYDHPEAAVSHILLRPGEFLLKHVTPVDVFFYVLEGEGEVEVGEEKVHVVKDMIIESPKDIPHRLMNEGKEDFRFLVVKTPKQAVKSTLL